jgi:NADPH2:quinone reductase
VVVTAYGGPEVLALTEHPPLVPADGELVVAVHAAGVNFMDTYLRRGTGMVIPTPFVLGVDGAGVVSAVGDGVDDFAVGDRVVWERVIGSYADEVKVRSEQLVRVPDDVALDVAAAGLMQALTAHHLSHTAVDAGAGTTALVHSAASGVGRMLTQFISRRGGRVIATVSQPQKAAIAAAAGADVVLARSEETDLAARVRELTDGRGVDVVYDGTGASACAASIASVAYGGTFVHFGQAGGPIPPLDLWEQPDGVRLMRSRGDRPGASAEAVAERSAEIMALIGTGEIDVLIGGRYPLEEAVQAHVDIESQSTSGKLMLVLR